MKCFIMVMISLFFVSCASVQKKSMSINAGDTKAQVMAAMGAPENRQSHGNLEAWQYCDTSFGHYNFALVWFSTGLVTGVNTYGRGPSPFSGCDHHYDQVNWENAPDQTIEIRHR